MITKEQSKTLNHLIYELVTRFEQIVANDIAGWDNSGPKLKAAALKAEADLDEFINSITEQE